MKFMVSGGAGFIGSAVVRRLIAEGYAVLVFDKLTYAGSLKTLESVKDEPNFRFERGDICDHAAVRAALESFQPDIIMHLAAESHVDRSIEGPAQFIQTNIVGTYTLLEEARRYYDNLDGTAKKRFRFHHISTDEVFGSLGERGAFTEESCYDPRSPYSASKASADHLVRAYFHTYSLPVVISNSSNNFGPYQFPEKLIPLFILNALVGKELPLYGKGENVRDWLYVEDHARALVKIALEGRDGDSYNVGGGAEMSNIVVAENICALLDRLRPRADGASYRALIRFVADRPGHDFRYAIDAAKVKRELGWCPEESFPTALEKTVLWYLDHADYWREIRENVYDGSRLGKRG